MPDFRSLVTACFVLAATPACGANWPFPPNTYLGMDCSFYRDRPRDVHVEVRFLDAHEVELLSDGGGTTLVPAGGGPSEVPFAEGIYATGAFSSGKYAVRAAREADGSLALHWTSDMPLPKGASQILVTAGGAIQDLRVSAVSLGLVGRDRFMLHLCIGPEGARYGGIVPTSRAATVDRPCEKGVQLSTPWSNVARVVEITAATPDYSNRPAPTVLSAQEACNLPPPVPESQVVIFDHASNVPSPARPY